MPRERRLGVVPALRAARADHPALLAAVGLELLEVRERPAQVRYVAPVIVLLEVELPEAAQVRKGFGRGSLEVVVEDGQGSQGREGADLGGETAGEVVVPEGEDLDVTTVAPPGPDYVFRVRKRFRLKESEGTSSKALRFWLTSRANTQSKSSKKRTHSS